MQQIQNLITIITVIHHATAIMAMRSMQERWATTKIDYQDIIKCKTKERKLLRVTKRQFGRGSPRV